MSAITVPLWVVAFVAIFATVPALIADLGGSTRTSDYERACAAHHGVASVSVSAWQSPSFVAVCRDGRVRPVHR